MDSKEQEENCAHDSVKSESPDYDAGSVTAGNPNSSPAPTRNPSPPKELINLNDSIGNTAFSKHWFFTTLTKLVEIIDNTSANKNGQRLELAVKPESGDGVASKEHPSKNQTDDLIDISDELQDELCQLWDMSSDEDVAQLLLEFTADQMLTEVIIKSRAPRLTEISVGILANMACTESVCTTMADNKYLVEVSMALLTNDDSPTLVETTRLLNAVLYKKSSREAWLQEWKQDEASRDQLLFILKSSTNVELLEKTAALLHSIMDLSEELCELMSSSQLIISVLEALKQFSDNLVCEAVFSLTHVLQLVSTQPTGATDLIEHMEAVIDQLIELLLAVCHDEVVNLDGSRLSGLASALSVTDLLLTSSPEAYSLLYSGEKFIRCLLKVMYACENDSQGYDEAMLSALNDSILNLLTNTVGCMKEQEIDVPSSDSLSQTTSPEHFNSQPTIKSPNEETSPQKGVPQSLGNPSSPPHLTVPSILKYMDRDCERRRLYSMLHLLQHNNAEELIADLNSLANRFHLDRLQGVLEEKGRVSEDS